MTFDTEWIERLDSPGGSLQGALEEGLGKIDEVFYGFDYDEGIVILYMFSERDSELLEDNIVEILLKRFPSLNSVDLDIEIDLDVEVSDFNDF
jgi:hypothetical protein